MPWYDKSKTAYLRAVDLTEKIVTEMGEVREATGISQNTLISFVVRRPDFGELVAGGLAKMQAAQKRGTADQRISCRVPRESVETIASAARSLAINREQVVSAALYAIRGRMRAEIFAQPA